MSVPEQIERIYFRVDEFLMNAPFTRYLEGRRRRRRRGRRRSEMKGAFPNVGVATRNGFLPHPHVFIASRVCVWGGWGVGGGGQGGGEEKKGGGGSSF